VCRRITHRSGGGRGPTPSTPPMAPSGPASVDTDSPDTGRPHDWITGSKSTLNRALGYSRTYLGLLERRRDAGELELKERGRKFTIRLKDPKRHAEVRGLAAKLSGGPGPDA
jgi:hypothetical protein